MGLIGGKQGLSLGQGCGYNHVVHEMLRAVGLHHLHSRPDRDEYIHMDLNNVLPQNHYTFQKGKGRQVTAGFDYYSIMLYTSRAFSSNGKVVITRSDNNKPVADDDEKPGMIKGDADEINKLYKCNGKDSKLETVDEPDEYTSTSTLTQSLIPMNWKMSLPL